MVNPSAPAIVQVEGNAGNVGWVHTMYEALSWYLQLANWRARGNRSWDFTLHKTLAVDATDSSPAAGARFVNELLQEHAGLRREPHVLDAGCGFGGTIFFLQERLGGTYDGFTMSRVQRRIARKEALRRGIDGACRIHLRNFDDPIEEQYDAVVAIESLEHAPDLRHTLGRLAGALKPGGVLMVVEDMVMGDIDVSHPEEAQLLRRHWGCLRFPRVDDYETLLPEAGLDIGHRVDLTSRVRHRRVAELDVIARRYAALFRRIPIAPVRGLISAYLGGVALEKLYASNEARYRLLIATKRNPAPPTHNAATG